ncbi:MAG: toprim domain-containing protein, partial [Campylobacterales bacterium]
MDYKDTLLLPKTSFPMRGNLPQNEPKRYKKWSEDLFPFIPEEYETKISKEKYKRNQFNIVKGLFLRDDVDFIINATDADREGELIFRYVYEL